MELGPIHLISLEFKILIISTFVARNLLSIMVLIIDFDHPVQEILQNNYLKTNFEISKIRDFVPTFCFPAIS